MVKHKATFPEAEAKVVVSSPALTQLVIRSFPVLKFYWVVAQLGQVKIEGQGHNDYQKILLSGNLFLHHQGLGCPGGSPRSASSWHLTWS